MSARYAFQNRLSVIRKAYHDSDRKEKGKLLQTLEKMTGYNRKYLITLLNGALVAPLLEHKRRRRGVEYSEAAIDTLYQIWKRTGRLSPERLKAQLPLLLPHAAQHIKGCTAAVTNELLRISARQMSRRLRQRKAAHRRQTNSATRRARLLRHMVEVSTQRPQEAPPGLLEFDTVAHCGDRLQGQFVWTVNSTDVATGWVVCAPVLGVAAVHVVPIIDALLQRLPFAAYEIHSDNGGEFINHHLWRLCKRRRLTPTRGRPHHKNDNARIEQKNWTQVRRVIGYGRYDNTAQLEQMRRIYDVLEVLTNLFEPSAKLVAKTRDNAAVRRQYDTPMTPLDRLVLWQRQQRGRVSPKVKRWMTLRNQTDPFALYEQLETEIERLRTIVCKAA